MEQGWDCIAVPGGKRAKQLTQHPTCCMCYFLQNGAIEEPGFTEDFGGSEVTGVEASFSDNLPPPQLRRATVAHDFTPESEEEVRREALSRKSVCIDTCKCC